MKLLLSFFLLLLISCSQNKPAPQQQNNVPKALEEKSAAFSVVSKRYDNDIVQSLYNELLKEDKDLQKFEDGIEKINSDKPDSLEYFHSFVDKNSSYYSSADRYLSSIKDSVLKNRIKQILAESNTRFESGLTQHKNLIQQIETKENQLADLHFAVKIIKTLPVIEKYQRENRPSLNPIQTINNEFGKLIAQADAMLKK
ncbi:MAG: hypothetical protein IPK31_17540 [Chitinophagaceae bacterium]|nr:hypothetical protein [Chitinophagaceae bacterium]